MKRAARTRVGTSVRTWWAQSILQKIGDPVKIDLEGETLIKIDLESYQ